MIRTSFLVFLFSLVSAFSSVSVFISPDAAALVAARKMADQILQKKTSVLGLATGNTMIPVYAALKKILIEEDIDLSEIISFNLDEYLDLPSSHPQSFRSFMFTHLFEDLLYSPQNPRGIREENIHFPSHPSEYETLLEQVGPIDLQILGIGRNGHIGFAEPGTPFSSLTAAVHLTETTRQDNAHSFGGDLNQVPQKAITMGIATILRAKEILLLAFGEAKAEAIADTLRGPLSPETPASALREHPNTSFFLDEKAAHLLNDSQIQRFYHARILLDHQLIEGELWVSGGKIIPPQEKADLEIDVGGNILAPGFIDLQINGGFGCDFSRNPEKIEEVAKQLLSFGVTSFLPTVISSSPEQYRRLLPKLQPRSFGKEGATILGIHLEGPFFSPAYSGAHNPSLLLSPEKNSLERTYGSLEGVKLVTLAPELLGASSCIELLQKQNIVVSAGHSAANFDQMRAGIDSGIRLATHLFNAMTPYHHRNPGIIGSVLLNPSLPYTLIADGLHLCPECILLCWRCHPEGLILISDATEALGMPDGNYQLGSLNIEARSHQIYLAGTQTLAGSNLQLDEAVRRLHAITQCSPAEALEAASLKPAELLNLSSKGTLTPGADADFLILSPDLTVQATYLGGQLAWPR